MTVKSFLFKLTQKVGYLFAVCIILAAFFVSVMGLLTPLLDKHRPDFEIWASNLLRMPVAIDQARVSWHQYQPEITLNRVTVLNKDSQDPLLQVQKVRVFFSILRSIWEWKPVPASILIAGADINVYRAASGQINIQGFPAIGGFQSQPFKQEAQFPEVLAWLSEQPKLILHDINIRYAAFSGEKKFVTLHNLNITNSHAKHIISGKAILHQAIPTEVTVAIEWIGNALNLSEIKAKCYLYLTGVSLAQWLQNYSLYGWQIKEGLASAKVWADWQNGQWLKIQTNVQLYHVALYADKDKTTHVINRLSGNIGWKKENNTQILAGDDILIDLPSRLWPVTNFYVSFAEGADKKLSPKIFRMGYVDLQDIQSFLFSSPPVLASSYQDMLAARELRGALQDVNIMFLGAWNDGSRISFNTNFNRLRFLPGRQFPGMTNVTGAIKWDGTQGELSLNSNQTVFQYDSIFANPIAMDQLVGTMQWQKSGKGAWLLQVKSLQALNQDLSMNVSGTVTTKANTSPTVDLVTNFTMQKANHISRYLPLRLFSPYLAEWLQKAFLAGWIESGKAILQGSLADFPFDQGKGSFSMIGLVRNLDLRYAVDWPLLHNVDGTLTFTGRRMVAEIDSGQILDIPLAKIKSEIPAMGGAKPVILQIAGMAVGNLKQGLRFIYESPLQRTLGKTLSDLELQGPMQLHLELTIPLTNPGKAEVKGDITLQNADLILMPWRLSINNLNGLLHFTEKSIEAKQLQGQLFNKPIQLSLETLPASTRATLSGDLDMADLEKWLAVPLAKFVQGKTHTDIQVDFSAKAPTEAHIRSNLIGVTVNLPAPYAKKAEEPKDFLADIILETEQPLRVRLTYANFFSVALNLEQKAKTFRFVGGELHLGSGTASWPTTPGFYITGQLDQLNWDKIKSYIDQYATNSTGSLLRRIDIRTNEITILGQRFTQAQLEMMPDKNNWEVRITSPEAIGQLRIPNQVSSQALLTGQFEKLHLRSPAPDQVPAAFNLKSLPTLSFTSNDVRYNDMQLGQVSFKTASIPQGVNIKTLHISSPQIDLQATGQWTEVNGQYRSHLHGKATSSNVSRLLDSLGFTVHNFIASTGHFEFNLQWHDEPYAPSVATMTGKASLALGKGRIVEVQGGAAAGIGRMLSLFSLQTIPRRLTFDFSDIFEKGYSFDSLSGNVTFREGSAFTNDMRFDGPVAQVNLYGRIGLVDKDYDLTLSVTPHVTSSLPVAATLLPMAVNPLLLVAVAWIANQTIGTEVSKAATYYYEVSGSWDNPIWKSVSSSDRR